MVVAPGVSRGNRIRLIDPLRHGSDDVLLAVPRSDFRYLFVSLAKTANCPGLGDFCPLSPLNIKRFCLDLHKSAGL